MSDRVVAASAWALPGPDVAEDVWAVDKVDEVKATIQGMLRRGLAERKSIFL